MAASSKQNSGMHMVSHPQPAHVIRGMTTCAWHIVVQFAFTMQDAQCLACKMLCAHDESPAALPGLMGDD